MGPHMLEDKGSLVWEEEEEEGILWKKTFWGDIFLPHLSQYFQYFFFCHNLCQGGYVQVFVCLSF